MKASTEIIVRWSDCDPMGHVNNAVYITYMEQARIEFFRKFFGLKAGKRITPDHFRFIIAENSCRYLKPVYVDQTLTVEINVTEVKNSSFVFGYEMKDKRTGDAVASGRSVQVWFDYKTEKSIPIPEEYRKKLSEE